MKNIITTIGLLVSLVTPSFASRSLTLESFQFVRNHNEKHYGAQVNIQLGNLNLFGRKAFDSGAWKENEFGAEFQANLDTNTYWKLRYENRFDDHDSRVWLFAGKKVNF